MAPIGAGLNVEHAPQVVHPGGEPGAPGADVGALWKPIRGGGSAGRRDRSPRQPSSRSPELATRNTTAAECPENPGQTRPTRGRTTRHLQPGLLHRRQRTKRRSKRQIRQRPRRKPRQPRQRTIQRQISTKLILDTRAHRLLKITARRRRHPGNRHRRRRTPTLITRAAHRSAAGARQTTRPGPMWAAGLRRRRSAGGGRQPTFAGRAWCHPESMPNTQRRLRGGCARRAGLRA